MKKNINFSAEEFVGKLNDEIAKQNLENLGAVVDNAGSIVISNAETEEECIINSNSSDDIEAFLKFVIENGLKITKKNIANFAEMTHFGQSVKVGKSFGNLTNKNNADKFQATKLLASLSSNFAQFKVNIDKMINSGAANIDKKLAKQLANLSKNYEGLSNNIDNIVEKYLQGDSFLEFKKKEEKLLKNADKIDTTEAEERLKKYEEDTSKSKDVRLKEIAEEFNDIKATYERAKQVHDEAKMKKCAERVSKLKEEKAKLVNMSEMNFDDNKREQAIENLKKKYADILGKQKAFLAANKQEVDNATFKSRSWKLFKETLSKKLESLINAIEKLDTKYGLSIAQEKIAKLAEKLVEEHKKWDQEFESFDSDEKSKQEETKSDKPTKQEEEQAKQDNNGLVSKFNEATGLSLNSNEKNETILKKAIEGDSEAQKQIRGVLKNKGLSEEKIMEVIGKLKGNTNESGFDFSDSISKVFSEKVTNFDAHKVKDSEFGIVYEDKFGSLWSDDPDTNSNADILWESADGKEEPTTEDKTDEDENENANSESAGDELGEGSEEEGEGRDELDLDSDSESGDDELDLDSDTGDESSEDELFSEDNDGSGDELDLDSDEEDLDLDLDSEDNDDELDLDTDDNEDENNTEETEKTSEGENLSKALDVIQSMYQVLAEKIK